MVTLTTPQIIEVNHTSTEAVTHDKAVSLLQTNPDGVQMKVIRVVDAAFVNQPEEEIIDMHFEKGNFDGFGFSIAGGNNTPIEVPHGLVPLPLITAPVRMVTLAFT